MRLQTLICLLLAAAPTISVRCETVAEIKTAAEKGDAAAQFRYGEMLRDGNGVKKNVMESVAWMRKAAADAGYAPAQCQMGLFYMNGLGVDRDEDKAVEWLEKAAAQNHLQAQSSSSASTPLRISPKMIELEIMG